MSSLIKLSKQISYALRHNPEKYGLALDEEGWVEVEQLIEALRRIEKWKNISDEDIKKINRISEKKRFEIKDGRIRAYYGHSIPMKIIKEESVPPDILYHGTARRFLDSIMKNGLLPQGRQYVHLSQDIETARKVGSRHDDKPVILQIDSKRAWEDGTKFYLGNEKVWLADQISWRYMKAIQEEKSE